MLNPLIKRFEDGHEMVTLGGRHAVLVFTEQAFNNGSGRIDLGATDGCQGKRRAAPVVGVFTALDPTFGLKSVDHFADGWPLQDRQFGQLTDGHGIDFCQECQNPKFPMVHAQGGQELGRVPSMLSFGARHPGYWPIAGIEWLRRLWFLAARKRSRGRFFYGHCVNIHL